MGEDVRLETDLAYQSTPHCVFSLHLNAASETTIVGEAIKMFTGIIEELGDMHSIRSHGDGCRLKINAHTILSDVSIGDSISVNGCCLTVVEYENKSSDSWFAVDVVPESLSLTTMGKLAEGEIVNLERSMSANGRFGGHVVQGHVDAIAEVLHIHDHEDGSKRLTFNIPKDVSGQIVRKGSIALDGISLTVASTNQEQGTFDIAVIPHTLEVTTLGKKIVGDQVNVEADLFARYIAGIINSDSYAVLKGKN
ncbi:MAG: riboflavin synthase [Actinomycetota bacterium]|nr:riboflavin synthase [Actinomycetota bacterium]